MSQQLFLRDDMLEFSNKLDMENFNIKAYRKRKSTTSKKLSLLNPSTQCGLSQQNILNINQSMEKAGINIQKLSDIRISATAAIRKRKDLSQDTSNQNRSINVRTQVSNHKRQDSNVIQTAKINYESNRKNSFKQQTAIKQQAQFFNIRQTIVEPSKVNKFVEITKKYNKGNIINQKYLENWLDQVLIQYCQQEKFDKTIQNPALKKMGLDRNSLLSQGIKPQHVNRVYKTMFVYSIGFNNLLKQLAGKNMNLRKTIWKVYAILLQYCAQGTFETMIGQIQRDKARKLESLREQIQKRQKIIQNNDQINEQKNSKIFKELKILREQNANLQNQKNVLLQDFKQAEQSFNQEVSLRLKFENKINQIHGVHHELATKHNRLYIDYHKKIEELDILNQKHIKLNQIFLINKQKMENAIQELQTSKKENAYFKDQISNLQQIRLRFQNFQIEQKNNREDLQNIIKQKLRKVSQLQVQLQNSDIMLKMKNASSKQLESQYRQSLQQNKKLNNTIKEQITQLNELFIQKKQFSDKHLSYIAQIQFLKNKDSQNKIIIQKLKKTIVDDQEYKDKITIENTNLQQKVALLARDLNDCMENIQNMKRTKNIFEDQLNYVKKRVQLHGQVVKQKDILITQLTKKVEKISKQNQQYITLNKTLDSKTTVLSQKLRSQQEMSRKKYEKLKQERDQLFKQNSQHNVILTQKIQQLQKYRSLYDSQTLNLKNQRFQRVNLDLRYKQSLQVMQSQNQHIKNLNILISQNKEQIQQLNRKIRNTEYILKQKERIFQVEIKQLNIHLDDSRKQLNKKKMFVNPMILQDLKGLLQRQIEKTVKLKKQIQNYIKEKKKIQQQNLKTLNSLKQAYIKQNFQLKQIFSKKIQDKQYEIQYEKQKSKHLSEKTNQLQILIQGLNSSAENQSVKALKQRQKKYLTTIKQKSDQTQKLLKQLESAHDHNNILIKRLSEIDSIIAKKDEQLTKLQQVIQKMGQQIQQKDKTISGVSQFRQRQKQFSNSNEFQDEEQNLNSLSIIDEKNNQNKRVKSKMGTNNEQGSNKKNNFNSNKKTSKQQTQEQCEKSDKKISTEKIVNPVWRNDFSKKLKNAFTYYKN